MSLYWPLYQFSPILITLFMFNRKFKGVQKFAMKNPSYIFIYVSTYNFPIIVSRMCCFFAGTGFLFVMTDHYHFNDFSWIIFLSNTFICWSETERRSTQNIINYLNIYVELLVSEIYVHFFSCSLFSISDKLRFHSLVKIIVLTGN
jgi:hypothetical protein